MCIRDSSYIIKLGKGLAEMPAAMLVDENKVKGCQSQVWLFPDMEAPLSSLRFYASSDAVIARGLIALLLQVYNGSTAEEILKDKADFVETLGLQNHLSPSRSNGITAMIKQIKMFAFALKAKHGAF